jgi:hypothetical protein
MKTIIINRQSLESKLTEAYQKALDFDWTGWRIPIYLDEETGQCSLGGWLSISSWVPDKHELPINVVTWNMEEMGFENPDDEDLNYELNDKVNWYIDLLESDHYVTEEYKYKVN